MPFRVTAEHMSSKFALEEKGAVAHKSCATAFFVYKKASALAKGRRRV